MNGTHPIISI